MDGKPNHYDGSIQNYSAENVNIYSEEPFILTDDIRKNLGGNPYILQNEGK
ncbi:hypothetical protein [Sutcliffiella rhizosphaerae]|uniref:Uncharacterized protein n=1 Tax=Sutcliffiella rhizosphaerae TaxID=2880967 RepID=A0ABM8YPA2_9BACI|nr:hypothetical protein [Sutcliffiella rhizosphaerae]CAG9621741.1 hypothetical protein BACCIP111883_02514 [Sutcliffiella rhizosphaerae]